MSANCTCHGSVEREMLRRLTAENPALAARLVSLGATVNAHAGVLTTGWRVCVDSDPRPVHAEFRLPASANWPDGLAKLQDAVKHIPAPDYAARGLRASMASASL